MLLPAAGAYFFTRRHATDPQFSFGTGKVGAYSSVIENASGDPLFVPAQ